MEGLSHRDFLLTLDTWLWQWFSLPPLPVCLLSWNSADEPLLHG